MVVVLVLLTVLAFVVVEILLVAGEARKREGAAVAISAAKMPPALGRVFVPPGVFLDAGHTWLGLEPSGAATIGLDDFVVKVLGRIDRVELPREGTEVERGEPLFAIQQGDRRASFAAPVDGIVTSSNGLLSQNTDPLRSEPYASGWICRLKPANLARNLRRLRLAEEAQVWLQREKERLQKFLMERAKAHPVLGAVSQDGGELAQGLLEKMDSETWRLFTAEFLKNQGP